MPALLLYLLKVNVALALFYLAYHVALRRLTFYHLNRMFLVFGIVFSTVYPLIDLSGLFQNEEQLDAAYIVTIPAWAYTASTITAAPETFDFWQILIGLFWLGVAVMLIRFIVQLVSLYKIHVASEPASYRNIGFRRVKNMSQAFSFWQTIYLDPSQHKAEELESILRHELIHITGWHSLDVILAELSTVFYWFNPGAWLMKKAVKENLEFIADQNVVNTGVDKKEYQYLLLKVVGATQPQIANQFNFPSLKRRIAMMNKMPTRKTSQLRLLIALPLAATLLFAFRNAAPITDSVTEIVTESRQQDGTIPKELIDYLKKNKAIKNARAQRINGKDALVLNIRGGGTEVYYLGDAESIAILERKYGLPELPPPPPPVRVAEELPPPPPPAPAAIDSPPAPPVSGKEEIVAEVIMPMERHYFIDGVMSNKESALALDREAIHSINVFRDEAAQQLLGDKTATGVVSIITKQNKDKKKVQEFLKKMPELPPPPPPVKPTEAHLEKMVPVDVVYYLDGKEDKNESYKKLDAKQIYSVNVYKGESAQKIAGRKAAKGLVSIISKENQNSPEVTKFNKKLSAEFPVQPGVQVKITQQEKLPTPPPPTPQDKSKPYIFILDEVDYYKDQAKWPAAYKDFLKRNPNVEKVGWKFSDRKDWNLESIVIYLKSGKTEVYDYNKNPRIPAAEVKYGELPQLPPPPPPTAN